MAKPVTRLRTQRVANKRRTAPLRVRLFSFRPATWRDGGRRVLKGLRTAAPALLTAASVGAVITSGVIGYRWLTGSPRFALASVEVEGSTPAATIEIERILEPALGQNVFELSLSALERRLAAHPSVAEVEVRRDLPDSLVVSITEREAVAVAELGGLYLIDDTGRAFRRADIAAGEGAGLPIITGVDRANYHAGIDAAAKQLRAAYQAAEVYAEVSSRPPLGEIHTSAARGLTLYLREPVTALRVGSPENPDVLRARLSAFDQAWTALSVEERAHATTLHLDRDGHPLRVTVAFAQAR